MFSKTTITVLVLCVTLFAFCAVAAMADEAEDLVNSGLAYAEKGDVDRAIADFEAVLRINPNHAEAMRNLTLALHTRRVLQIRDNTP